MKLVGRYRLTWRTQLKNESGRLSVPAKVLQELGFRPGDELELWYDEEKRELVYRPVGERIDEQAELQELLREVKECLSF